MPTYEYECRACAHKFELQQSMKDDPITQCPSCKKDQARRLFSHTGIVFKGAGFYVNDKKSSSCGHAGCASGSCQGSS
ncbi:MAG: FmdB family zinc ribbon protein [Spirochaetia bacterium]